MSLATGGLMGIGAFAMVSGTTGYHLPLPVAILFGAIAGVFGLLLGVIVHQLSFVLTVIVTLGFRISAPMFMGGRYAPWIHLLPGGAAVLPPSYIRTPLRLVGGFLVLGLITGNNPGEYPKELLGHTISRRRALRSWLDISASAGIARVYAYGVSGVIAGFAGVTYELLLNNISQVSSAAPCRSRSCSPRWPGE